MMVILNIILAIIFVVILFYVWKRVKKWWKHRDYFMPDDPATPYMIDNMNKIGGDLVCVSTRYDNLRPKLDHMLREMKTDPHTPDYSGMLREMEKDIRECVIYAKLMRNDWHYKTPLYSNALEFYQKYKKKVDDMNIKALEIRQKAHVILNQIPGTKVVIWMIEITNCIINLKNNFDRLDRVFHQ